MRRRGLVVAVAAVAAVVGLGAPALADDTVTVHGTDFPDPRAAQLSLVGCESLYERGTELLQPYLSRGPGTEGADTNVPLGERALKFDLAGGNAIGTLSYVDSMLGTEVAGLQVFARPGAEGVAYAGFQAPDAEGHDLWIGRAPLAATGSWAGIDATSLNYTWTEFDMRSGQPTGRTEGSPATVPSFAAGHGGDGAGFYLVGFGCDGAPFYLDAWRVGAPGTTTTYDLEALTTHLTMGGSSHAIEAGDEVTLDGSVRDGAGRRLMHGTLILEARPVGAAGFLPVRVVDAANTDPSVTVTPNESTIYRWRFAERPLATGSVSAEFRVDVVRPEPVPEPAKEPRQVPRSPERPEPSAKSPDAQPPAPTAPVPPSTPETTAPEPTPTPEAVPEPTPSQ